MKLAAAVAATTDPYTADRLTYMPPRPPDGSPPEHRLYECVAGRSNGVISVKCNAADSAHHTRSVVRGYGSELRHEEVVKAEVAIAAWTAIREEEMAQFLYSVSLPRTVLPHVERADRSKTQHHQEKARWLGDSAHGCIEEQHDGGVA